MGARSRRKFSPQFKAEAVQLVIQSDRSIAEVAGELDINPGTLGRAGAWFEPGRSWPVGGAGRAKPQVEDGE